MFLLKILNNRIDCPTKLEKFNYKMSINKTRNNDTSYLLPKIKINYSLLTPVITFMSVSSR